MFAYGMNQEFTSRSDRVDIDFLCIFNHLCDDDWMIYSRFSGSALLFLERDLRHLSRKGKRDSEIY